MTEKAPNGLPKVSVPLVGEDGNAYAIMGRVTRAMRRAGWPDKDIKEYQRRATSGDYDHLLQVTLAYADNKNDDDDDTDDEDDEEDEEDEE